jgi:hypothetical protein
LPSATAPTLSRLAEDELHQHEHAVSAEADDAHCGPERAQETLLRTPILPSILPSMRASASITVYENSAVVLQPARIDAAVDRDGRKPRSS